MTGSVFTPCQRQRRDNHTSVHTLSEAQEGAKHTSVSCRLSSHHSRSSLLPHLPLSGVPLGGGSQPTADLVCLSGMNGSTLWSSPLPEEAQDVTCLDLMPGSMAKTICLVTGTRKMLSAFNATTGRVSGLELCV